MVEYHKHNVKTQNYIKNDFRPEIFFNIDDCCSKKYIQWLKHLNVSQVKYTYLVLLKIYFF